MANLHILKTRISLERKEIFEKSKQHFSSQADYLFMFQNGFDRKDAIFVIVPLSLFQWFSLLFLARVTRAATSSGKRQVLSLHPRDETAKFMYRTMENGPTSFA